MKKILLLLCCFTSINVFALPDDLNVDYRGAEFDNFDKYGDPKTSEYILKDLSSTPQKYDLMAAKLHLYMRQVYKSAKTKEEVYVAGNKMGADYNFQFWTDLKDKKDKAASDKYVGILKDKFKAAYTATPALDEVDKLITIDQKNHTYTYQNKVYNMQEQVIQTLASASSGDCKWDLSSLRRILHGSGCTDGASRICSGYMICTKDGVEKRSLATCSASNCSTNKASDCAAEKGYGSENPTDLNSSPGQGGGGNQGGTHQ